MNLNQQSFEFKQYISKIIYRQAIIITTFITLVLSLSISNNALADKVKPSQIYNSMIFDESGQGFLFDEQNLDPTNIENVFKSLDTIPLQEDPITQGVTLINQGDKQAGIKALQQAWKDDPKRELIAVTLGNIYIKDQKYDLALALAKELQNNLPRKPHGFTLEGLIFRANNKSKQAKNSFKNALLLNPSFAIANHGLAAYEIAEGNIENARKLYHNALDKNPYDVRTPLLLSKLEFEHGNQPYAFDLINKTIEKFPELLAPPLLKAKLLLGQRKPKKAIEIATSLLEKFPNHVELIQLIAVSNLNAKLPLKAIEILNPAITTFPKNHHLHFILAKAYLQLGQPDNALQKLDTALSIKDEHPESLFLKANILVSSKKYNQATKILNRLEKSYPEKTQVNELQARIAMMQGNNAKALKIFKKAFKKSESSLLAMNIANAQLRIGEKYGSSMTLNNWLKDHPTDNIVRTFLADQLRTSGKYDIAQKHYEHILTLQPRSAATLNNLAWLLEKKGKYDEGLELARKANKIIINSPHLMDTLASLLMHKGQYKEASKLLEHVSTLQPKNLNIQYQLAKATAGKGESKLAKVILHKLLNQNKSFSDRSKAEELLNKLGN